MSGIYARHFFGSQGIGFHRNAVDIDLSLIGLKDPAAGFDRGCFSGAVVPDKTVDLPRQDMQGQVVHSLFRTVGFCEILNFKHVFSSLVHKNIGMPKQTEVFRILSPFRESCLL